MSAVQTMSLAAHEAAAWCLQLSEGRLQPAEQAQFQAWLDADPAHAQLFDEAVALWAGVEDQSGSAEMIVLRGAALESMRRANSLRWARTAAASPRILAVAASLLLAVVAVLWQWTAGDTYSTGIGEREVVALADGSKLSLDADTKVRVRFTRSRRELALEQGRARFTVARDPLKPFTVTASGKTVVAVGTEFSVERVADQVRVILYEGKVSVLAPSPGAKAAAPVRVGPDRRLAEAVLKPGGELIIAGVGSSAQLVRTDLTRSLSWEGGQLVFVDEPLGRAVERVNRYSDRKIRLADASAANVLVSGIFTAGDTAAFVDGVTAVFPLEAQTGQDATTISFDVSRSAHTSGE